MGVGGDKAQDKGAVPCAVVASAPVACHLTFFLALALRSFPKIMHHPRKRFGQNFLHDPSTIRRILSAVAPGPEDRLVEIGPGQGAITKGLLQASGRLDVVELDRSQCIDALCLGGKGKPV